MNPAAKETRSISLPSGQSISWLEYGDASGRPLFFYNGWPGSAEQAVAIDALAAELGWRVISVHRPSFGKTTPQPGRGLLDWPPLVAAVADHLGISRFHIMALSGGGPYALATAWALGQRVIALCLCCTAVPTDTPAARKELLGAYQGMLGLHDHSPWLVRTILQLCSPLARLPLPLPVLRLVFRCLLPPPDAAELGKAEVFQLFRPSYAYAVSAGGKALYQDGFPYTQPWSFPLGEITVPVHFWHGTQDENFRLAAARRLAAQLPNHTFNEQNEGHYSLPFRYARQMLLELAS